MTRRGPAVEKILFVVPPVIRFESFVRPAFNERTVKKQSGDYGSVVTDMPLGALSLSAYLKKHAAVETRLVDFNIVLNALETFEYPGFIDLFEERLGAADLAAFAPGIVAISTLFSPSYASMLDVASAARRTFPQALIVAGGGVPTNMSAEIFRDSDCFDALCFGEGERPLLGLVQAADRQAFLREHRSWITREKAAGGESFHHDLIEDLDEIPFLDYGLLDVESYRRNAIMSLFPLAEGGRKSMSVMTSRGCPHRCCFCSSHTVHGRRMRYQSLARVREDFERLQAEYGAEIMVFFDDHLMASRERVFEIVAFLRERGLTAFFPNSLALYALDRPMLEALKGIGVRDLVLSVESGSSRVLKEIMHKPLNLGIVRRVVADCRDLGIASDISILIGLPGETKQDIEDALAFLKTIDATWFRISMATPLLGSEMLEICIKKGYLKGDYLSCDFKRAIIETEDFTAAYIQEKAYAMNLELNFVENADFRLGNYETALAGFENTMKIKDDHAFAYYFAARCCRRLGREEQYRAYRERYERIVAESDFWRGHAERFGLGPLD